MVKQRELVKLAGPFEAEALRILREIPGLTVIAEPVGADREGNAILGFAGGEGKACSGRGSWTN